METDRSAQQPQPAARQVTHEVVLEFWFGPLDELGRATEERAGRWWRKDPDFDQTIRERFGPLHSAVVGGEREVWLDRPRSWLAYVIVLDQLSRNMFRDTPRMFAADERVLRAAKEGIRRGFDRQLRGDERVFSYMPLMHSEDLADQERCIALFCAFQREQLALAERLEHNLRFARAHREIIARFGRFPHRNAILGRPSTAEELRFLEEPGSSF